MDDQAVYKGIHHTKYAVHRFHFLTTRFSYEGLGALGSTVTQHALGFNALVSQCLSAPQICV